MSELENGEYRLRFMINLGRKSRKCWHLVDGELYKKGTIKSLKETLSRKVLSSSKCEAVKKITLSIDGFELPDKEFIRIITSNDCVNFSVRYKKEQSQTEIHKLEKQKDFSGESGLLPKNDNQKIKKSSRLTEMEKIVYSNPYGNIHKSLYKQRRKSAPMSIDQSNQNYSVIDKSKNSTLDMTHNEVFPKAFKNFADLGDLSHYPDNKLQPSDPLLSNKVSVDNKLTYEIAAIQFKDNNKEFRSLVRKSRQLNNKMNKPNKSKPTNVLSTNNVQYNEDTYKNNSSIINDSSQNRSSINYSVFQLNCNQNNHTSQNSLDNTINNESNQNTHFENLDEIDQSTLYAKSICVKNQNLNKPVSHDYQNYMNDNIGTSPCVNMAPSTSNQAKKSTKFFNFQPESIDDSEITINKISNDYENNKVDVDFFKAPTLTTIPDVGSIIAFKMVELSDTTCTPELSPFLKGCVENVTSKAELYIVLDDDYVWIQNMGEKKRFKIKYDCESDNFDTDPNINPYIQIRNKYLTINWKDLIEPKCLSEAFEI